jgi:hypothetical protein
MVNATGRSRGINGTGRQSMNLHKTQSAPLDRLSTCFGYLVSITSFILR